jgi:hypothetical protein
MKRTLLLTLLVISLVALGVSAKTTTTKKKKKPPCATDMAHCPPEGCGTGADPELNKAKNLTDAASGPQDKPLSYIKNLAQPKSWKIGDDRSSIQGDGKEGTHIRIKAFLQHAKQEGQETCNCKLSAPKDVDLHLSLVSSLSGPQSIKAAAVTAEITPRVRAKDHPEWTLANINKFAVGKYVRFTGFLMLDTQHVNRPFVRATNWEIHPVTDLEVCTKTKAVCDGGSGWKSISNLSH